MLRRIACAVAALLALSVSAAAQQPPVGINVDYNEQSTIDLVRQPRFSAISGNLTFDANGWPSTDFQIVVDNRYTFAWVPGAPNVDPLHFSTDISGVYKLSFVGQATVAVQTGGSMANKVYTSATNTTTADVTIANPAGGVLFILQFTATKRTPASPNGSGVTDVKLVRPGYSPTTTEMFAEPWLASLRDYNWSAVRYMGALGTNDYAASGSSEAYPYRLQWPADRVPFTRGGRPDGFHAGWHGVPWEWIVLTANAVHKDVWITVPVNASDDYVTQLAQLLKNGNQFTGNVGIEPNLKIYVEYSNELWHLGFPQGPWNQSAAIDEVGAGGSSLNYDGTTSQEIWRQRRIAKRTVEVGNQFKAVFGPERIRPVIDYSLVVFDARNMLKYVNDVFGPPSQFLYGISIPTYFGSSDTSSVAAIHNGERASSDAQRGNAFPKNRVMATYYGLKAMSYEGGEGETGNGSPTTPVDAGLPNQFAATRDSGMRDVYVHNLNNWYATGGDLFMQFAHVGRYSTYGFWGTTEDVTNLSTPKWLGVTDVMNAPAPALSVGTAIAASGATTFGAGSNVFSPTATLPIRLSTNGEYFFLLNAASSGAYKLDLSVQNSTGLGQGQVWVDGELQGAAFTVPSAPSGSPVVFSIGNVHLRRGLNALRLFVVKGANDPGGSTTFEWRINSMTATRANPSSTPGVHVASTSVWFLRNANAPGAADRAFQFGPPSVGWTPIRGDFDGDGAESAGLYDAATSTFFLRNANAPGGADLAFQFGAGGAGLVPVVGDWNGDGTDTVGLYNPATGAFFLRNTNAPGAADLVFAFGPTGNAGWQPLAGDWDANGTETIGLYAPSSGAFFLKNANTPGAADLVFSFGPSGLSWRPLAGDFDADGRDTVGVYDPVGGNFFLRNTNSPGTADTVVGFGPPGVTPIMGDWDGR